MIRSFLTPSVVIACLASAAAEETFVSIQQVSGNRMSVLPDSGGRGRGRFGGGADEAAPGGRFGRRGRGRFGGGAAVQPTTVTVPSNAKITSAMRERRTSEFRVGVELPGGLRNAVFRDLKSPLSARIVTDERGRITEVNVITAQTDINQTNTDDATGNTIIAVKPKRPPMKRP